MKFTRDHEWLDEDGRVGITDVACNELGDLVFVSVSEVGTTVALGEVFGEIESTKAVSELYAPAAGTIVEVNQPVIDDPSLISSDPLDGGWLIKIDVTDTGELLTEEEYRALAAG